MGGGVGTSPTVWALGGVDGSPRRAGGCGIGGLFFFFISGSGGGIAAVWFKRNSAPPGEGSIRFEFGPAGVIQTEINRNCPTLTMCVLKKLERVTEMRHCSFEIQMFYNVLLYMAHFTV